MPWVGIYKGEKKGAFQVPRKTDVECVSCGGRMRVWSESSDGRARHFKHIGNMGRGESGGGGADCETVAESDKHIKWKTLTAERLLGEFGGNIEEIVVEKELGAPVSGKERRIADVAIIFRRPDPQLGDGLVVEVQHKNHAKDISETTADYVRQDYAVVWTDKSDYANDHCRLAEVDFRHRAREAVWPEHAPRASDWTEKEYSYRNIKARWLRAAANGLNKSGAPATLPREWNDQMAKKIWHSQKWNRLVRKNCLGTFEFTEMEVWHADDYISELARQPTKHVVDATIPSEYFDELGRFLYNWTPWDDLFQARTAAHVRAQATIPKTDATRQSEVSFPPSCIETWIYESDAWKRHSPYTHDHPEQSPSVTLDIDFAPIFDAEFWRRAYQQGLRADRHEIERPKNPFDDVQCHNCGSHRLVKNAGEKCGKCGTYYDWEWNVNTGRISEEAVPNSVERRY